jgi:hypothetical protein
MARSTSAVERTFVTCSAPNITGGNSTGEKSTGGKSTGGVIVYIESRSSFNTLKNLTKNYIIFSGFFKKNNTILCQKWMNRQGHTLFMSKLFAPKFLMRFKFLQATQVDHSGLHRSGRALLCALPPPWSTCGSLATPPKIKNVPPPLGVGTRVAN